MHQPSDHLDPKLEALLLSKGFEELSREEQQYVDQLIDETSYRQYRHLLIQSQQVFKADANTPVSPVSSRLKEALVEKRSPGWFEQINALIRYQIPLWQAGLAMLLLTFVFSFLRPTQTFNVITSAPIETPQEAPLQEAPIKSSQQLEPSIANQPSQTTSSIDSPQIAYVENPVNDSTRFASRSFSKDRELMNLRVEMR